MITITQESRYVDSTNFNNLGELLLEFSKWAPANDTYRGVSNLRDYVASLLDIPVRAVIMEGDEAELEDLSAYEF